MRFINIIRIPQSKIVKIRGSTIFSFLFSFILVIVERYYSIIGRIYLFWFII